MIIKATFNDNDFTYILDNFFLRKVLCFIPTELDINLNHTKVRKMQENT